ncbi:MAG: 2-hydroxyacid dehydrogenase [Thaumarchaeota archaeon]|nr:2-hydroxyacid dehydrogenase [Candidatus Calditenuaceae archaeon]
MRRKVLVNAGEEWPADLIAELSEHAEVIKYGTATVEDLRDAEVLVTLYLSPDDLKLMHNLKFIQVLSAGVDHLNWSVIPEDVMVCTNAGSNAEPVAEHAMALLLAAAKRVTFYDSKCKSGDFSRPLRTALLKGSTLTVLGLGPIGLKVAEHARSMGMKVRGYVRRPRSYPSVDELFLHPDIAGALRGAEAGVVALPLNKHTRGLIDYEALSSMKRNGILVNVARGPIVVKEDLMRFLNENPDFVYATDVWWNTQDLSKDWDIAFLPNVISTPWVAGAFGNPAVFGEMVRSALLNVLRYLRGDETLNRVDRSDYV